MVSPPAREVLILVPLTDGEREFLLPASDPFHREALGVLRRASQPRPCGRLPRPSRPPRTQALAAVSKKQTKKTTLPSPAAVQFWDHTAVIPPL